MSAAMKKNPGGMAKLRAMSQAEWESLCDGCGRCCMHKLEDEDTGNYYATSVSCALLDCESCRCVDYENRKTRIADCIRLTPDMVQTLPWLPEDCAYRLVAEGKPLKWWHHLVSGSHETVHEAGISVRGKVEVREDQLASEDDYLAYIIGPL
ncbi:MAG: Hypothetical protein BHV28_09670 [Candidatus Tokpelaia hoelldobleri]|uniref:UPF0260 protein BHV28_09670 n=1 Tax=Candidatus Tokpelaia hoelldobleri TaxID=1902579 RepID=A0A1U9JUV5_9HYPH|nr:MAG: Hypothetical protein BHV28_09670 [Candidatus Tokpelaia hoelldoblerii]